MCGIIHNLNKIRSTEKVMHATMHKYLQWNIKHTILDIQHKTTVITSANKINDKIISYSYQKFTTEEVEQQHTKQSNHTYQTSPMLCIPTAPFWADRPHRLHPEIFRILFVLAWHTKWSFLLHDVIGDWMIPFTTNVTATLQQRFHCFWMSRITPKITHNPWGSAPHLLHGSLVPPVFIQNCVSIGSAVFAQLTIDCPLLYNGPLHFPQNCPFPLGYRVPHLTHGT